jgi:uncharacterized protein YkwD
VRGGVASIIAFGVLAAITASGAASRSTHAKRLLTTREAALVAEINAVRAGHALPRLSVDARLLRAARAHSRDMLRRQYFAHGDFGRRILRFGARGRVFAENLVWGSGIMSARTEVAQWLASPPHRANLLDPNLRRVGVATPVGSFAGFSPATMVTADFAG